MKFEGEHLLPGQIGHFFVLLSFIASIIATISFFKASRTIELTEKQNWLITARLAFYTQVAGVFVITPWYEPPCKNWVRSPNGPENILNFAGSVKAVFGLRLASWTT